MTEVNIPSDRAGQVTTTVQRMVANFVRPLDSIEDFLSSYHPDIEWYDHAFLMHRIGHNAVLGLYQAFNHCNLPFDVEIKVRTRPSSKLDVYPRGSRVSQY